MKTKSRKQHREPFKQASDSSDNSFLSFVEPFKFITWIGASAGALTIILAVIGFLSLGAHDAMLGIPRKILPQTEYVSVGGLFFSRSLIFALAAILSLLNDFLSSQVGVALIILLFILVVLYFLKVFSGFSKFFSISKEILLKGAPLILIILEIYALYNLTVPLQINNLLLQVNELSSVAASNIESETMLVLSALFNGDDKFLQLKYGYYCLLLLIIAVFYQRLEVSAANSGNNNKNQSGQLLHWYWLRVPALILILVCFFLLTRSYGVLTVENEFPQFAAVVKKDPANNEPDAKPLFMLREDEKNFLLYDPCSQTILNIKRDSVDQFRVSAPKNVFTYQLKEANNICQQ